MKPMKDSICANDTFSIDRFGNYLKKFMTENHKTLLLYAVIIFVIPILFDLLVPYFSNYSDYREVHPWNTPGEDPLWDAFSGFLCFTFSLIGCISASMSFKSMSGKRVRISTLTNPASRLEKFLTYIIVFLAGYVIVFFLGIVVAEALRILSVNMFVSNPQNLYFMPLGRILTLGIAFESSLSGSTWSTLMFGVIFTYFAIFTLGSIVFERRSFALTFVTLLLLTCVIQLVGFSSITAMGRNIQPRFDFINNWSMTGVWVLRGLFAIIILGLYALSYLRFKESEIINRW